MASLQCGNLCSSPEQYSSLLWSNSCNSGNDGTNESGINLTQYDPRESKLPEVRRGSAACFPRSQVETRAALVILNVFPVMLRTPPRKAICPVRAPPKSEPMVLETRPKLPELRFMIRIAQVGVVEHVGEGAFRLHLEPLGDGEGLAQAGRKVDQAGPIDRSHLAVAKAANRQRGVAVGRELPSRAAA